MRTVSRDLDWVEAKEPKYSPRVSFGVTFYPYVAFCQHLTERIPPWSKNIGIMSITSKYPTFTK